MKKKNTKILISILIIIGILLIGVKSYADFDVTYEICSQMLDGSHFRPNNLFDGSMFFCIDHGGSLNHQLASLTNSEKGGHTIWDNGYTQGWFCHTASKINDTAQSVGSLKQMIRYKRLGLITNQDFAYALTTAKAKGYSIMTFGMQQTVWGTSANLGQKVHTELSKEAVAYQQFYNKKEEQKKLTPKNPINLKDKTEYSTKEGDQKPTVAVDYSKQTYTVGTFKFTHLEGNYKKDEGSKAFQKPAQDYVNLYKGDLRDMLKDAKVIYTDIKDSIKKEKDEHGNTILNYDDVRFDTVSAVNFQTVYENAKKFYENDKNFTGNNLENKIQEIINQIYSLLVATTDLQAKRSLPSEVRTAINNISKYKDNHNMPVPGENDQTKFSYAKSITLIGVDEKGNERVLAVNDVKDDSQMEIVDMYGRKIMHKILESDHKEQTGELSSKTYNIPQSGDAFYVKFKLSKKNEDIKKIKVKIGTRYLEKCHVTAYKYQGDVYSWQWQKETGSVCCWGWSEYSGSYPRGYEKRAVLHIRQTGVKAQWLVGIPEDEFKNNAHKEWKSQEIVMGGKDGTGINITMDIEGYMFLDKDGGKVSAGNNLREDDEGLPGAEVWLYEYTKDNKEGKFVDIKLTDAKGHYSFKKICATKKYYVKFIYNGILYNNVEYNMDVLYNSDDWKKTSKAREINRGEFNDRYAEIGSYPSNYKIGEKMFGNELGEYNKTYLQEEISNLFKEISKEVVANKGDVKKACQIVASRYGNDKEIKNKVQFAADCRMASCTDRGKINVPGGDEGKNYVYPVYDKFTTTSFVPVNAAGVIYRPIYQGQRFINFGIKARNTVDLALYKDVHKAEVSINGKMETYHYDALSSIDPNTGIMKGFTLGVNQEDYIGGLRGAYKDSKTYKNNTVTRNVETDEYIKNIRTEEVTDAGSFDAVTNGVKYDLVTEDRLNIEIVYKISILNQSAVRSAITEVVDYYDNNFEYVTAYVGDENGKELGKVTRYENSIYADRKDTEFKSKKNAYQTMYLRPDEETRLDNNQKQYIYVRLRLKGLHQAGELLNSVLKSDTDKLTLLNLAEINGYKTYFKGEERSPGLIDIDSNPGNLNISDITALTEDNLKNYPNIKAMYEDDTRRAPSMVYKLFEPRTLSGTVFEDNTGWNNDKIHTSEHRHADGVMQGSDTKIQGVQVDLVEIKNNQLITRQTKFTDSNGNYTFTGFIPGDYTMRYTYGKNQETVMNTTSKWYKGVNAKSYNGQDFQSTIFKDKAAVTKTSYPKGDGISDVIDEYGPGNYWYTVNNSLSDARDDVARVNNVMAYSNNEYGVEITNHKAEVFKAYEAYQPDHITANFNKELATELAARTHRYAYTPKIIVEVEYATQNVTSQLNGENKYEHNIVGVDFGVVERPRAELVVDQEIARIKVTGADGATILFDSDGTGVVPNLNWTKATHNTSRYHGKSIGNYKLGELANIILDEELMNGAKIEITYKFTVTNNSEQDGNSTTAAKTILNYVGNNLDYDESKNTGWKVVKVEDIQNERNSTFVNNTMKSNGLKWVDLSTQSTILQTTPDNTLTKALAPGEQTTATLTLSKVMSTESAVDTLSYSNIAEIVEIANTVGRFDRGATPGNQDPNTLPREHDTTGAEGEGNGAGISDATVIVTPPTGSQYIYYVLGIGALIILAGGIFLIKKFVINKRK